MIKKWLCGAVISVMLLMSIPVYAADLHCGIGLGPCASSPVQGFVLFNTQTTGGAAAAVTTTLVAVAGVRTHVYSVSARCNTAAETSNITITDGGTTIWSSGPLAVVAATPFFTREWNTALTGATNSAVVITLAACATGTGTLIVQADKY